MKSQKLILIIIALFFGGVSYAQQKQRYSSLENLVKEKRKENELQQTIIKKYVRTLNPTLSKKLTESSYLLTKITNTGLPEYRASLNAGASITTGSSRLQNQLIGLNLEGANITVGVWDDGLVKNHIELGNRIISKEGTIESTHATHVSGTILASGVNASAKGMAPKALGTTWYFDYDDVEMASLAKPDQSTLLFSNHSYGTVTGFSKVSGGIWKWFGDPLVSNDEDYRHGFYGSNAQTLDDITVLAPYYTIVWAAGNDRAEGGDGSHPADGNAGTGYDCIIPEATAKNIITVGAINKSLSYYNSSSVEMSPFSSWGPTDDGRIKPDLVGAGVGIFSLSASGTNQYATLQGTSMSTPNVTGSLVLIQELHSKLHGGKFMRASTLKGLAIHTAKEAGIYPGPDYSYGWGVLDVEAAAKVLLQEDHKNIFVEELRLEDHQSYTMDIYSQAAEKITITICWTDPAGTPTQPALDPTTLMLVNDLDVHIVDNNGNVVSSWILDPSNPSLKATTGDNFRDNVEKIEFTNPEAKKYTIVVTHKNKLTNGHQDFSLIVTHKSSLSIGSTYYWIGNSGNWSDAAHWSLTSGGASANKTPDIDDNVIFDENSFSDASTKMINLTKDATCKKFTWLTDKDAGISLNAHILKVGGNMAVAGKNFKILTAGTIQFNDNDNSHSLDLHSGDFNKASLNFNGGNWTINGKLSADILSVMEDTVIMRDISCSLQGVNVASGSTFDFSGSTITGLIKSQITETATLFADSATIIITTPSQFNWNNINYTGAIVVDKGGNLLINGSNSFLTFNINPGAILQLLEASTQNITNFICNGNQSDKASLRSTTNATINFNVHQKMCFDFLDIKNVMVTGNSKLNAGTNSTLVNASNWLHQNCDDILFADFEEHFTCSNSFTELSDNSTGTIVTWAWDFGDEGSADNISTKEIGLHNYLKEGIYNVTLTISDGIKSDSYTRTMTINHNDLPENSIVLTGNSLLSFQKANQYQWYKNGEAIDGAIARSYGMAGETGSYQVVTTGAKCNVVTAPFLVTGIVPDHNGGSDRDIEVYPNPAKDFLKINLPTQNFTNAKFILYDALGRKVLQQNMIRLENSVDVSQLKDGFYNLEISAGAKKLNEKIQINNGQ